LGCVRPDPARSSAERPAQSRTQIGRCLCKRVSAQPRELPYRELPLPRHSGKSHQTADSLPDPVLTAANPGLGCRLEPREFSQHLRRSGAGHCARDPASAVVLRKESPLACSSQVGRFSRDLHSRHGVPQSRSSLICLDANARELSRCARTWRLGSSTQASRANQAVIGAAKRAAGARKKHRAACKALTDQSRCRGESLSGLRTLDHDHTH
jgi:hypothetical protein